MGHDLKRQRLAFAENAGFEVLLTTDKNIRYQQNLKGRKIAVVVLGNSAWRIVHKHVEHYQRRCAGKLRGSVHSLRVSRSLTGSSRRSVRITLVEMVAEPE